MEATEVRQASKYYTSHAYGGCALVTRKVGRAFDSTAENHKIETQQPRFGSYIYQDGRGGAQGAGSQDGYIYVQYLVAAQKEDCQCLFAAWRDSQDHQRTISRSKQLYYAAYEANIHPQIEAHLI